MLLRTVILKAPVGDGDNDLVTPELFEKLGRLCFTQLLELRHRGAFSTVSQTFAVFCRRCVLSNISSLRALPEMWYQVCTATFGVIWKLNVSRKRYDPSKQSQTPSRGGRRAYQQPCPLY